MTIASVAEDPYPDPLTTAGLRGLVELQRDTVAAIATGSPPDRHRTEYRNRRHRLLVALRGRGLPDPFAWPDVDVVWEWAKQWKSYNERREEVSKLVKPLLDRLDSLEHASTVEDWGSTRIGWSGLEQRLSGLRNEMNQATSLDHYQNVGRRCREVLIEVVNLTFTVDMVPDDQPQPKASDAKARFSYIIKSGASGRSHAELRKLMRATWELAQKVTHGDIKRVDAFAAAQATMLIVRTLAELDSAGRPGGLDLP